MQVSDNRNGTRSNVQTTGAGHFSPPASSPKCGSQLTPPGGRRGKLSKKTRGSQQQLRGDRPMEPPGGRLRGSAARGIRVVGGGREGGPYKKRSGWPGSSQSLVASRPDNISLTFSQEHFSKNKFCVYTELSHSLQRFTCWLTSLFMK